MLDRVERGAERSGADDVNVARRPEELAPARRAVAIGTFDGVHRGHRRVIEAAEAAHLRPTVVTFDPHPRAFFGNRVELLATIERRLELLEEAGVEDVLLLSFDESLALLDAEEFAESILRAAGAEVVAAGETFRFGRNRSGDLDLLERMGFDVRRVPLVDNVSSSHVRRLLATGDVRHAAGLLGRPAEVEGVVVLGDQRGGTLGFPTANLAVAPDLLVPAFGIYAGSALGHRAAVSIGTNPHYGGTERRVEAYLLDYAGDLYGRRVVVELWERLRDEAVFESEAELDRGDRRRRGAHPGGDPARLAARRPGGGGCCPLCARNVTSRHLRGHGDCRPEGSVARTAGERPLPGVRRDLLEAQRGRHRPEEPRLPDLRLRRLDPGQPAGGAASAAPLRLGSAAAPVRPIALTPPK